MLTSPYQLPVWDTITTAWHKVYGAKKTIWASLGIMILISVIIGALEGAVQGNAFLYNVVCAFGNLIVYFLQMGLIYMGIRRAIDAPIEWKMIFRVLTDVTTMIWIIGAYVIMFIVYIPPILFTAFGILLIPVSNLLSILCFALGVIGFIYLSARLLLTVGFVLDKNMNSLDAVKASFAATRSNIWNILGLIILQTLIIMVSIIPLGIGLIWTLPFALIVYGLAYQRLRVNAVK